MLIVIVFTRATPNRRHRSRGIERSFCGGVREYTNPHKLDDPEVSAVLIFD